MKDTIYRQDAIDAMSNALIRVFPEHEDIAKKTMGAVPSAQPERLSDDRKMIDTSPCDCSYCQFVRRIKEGKE